jgi:hypothetical protein
VSPSSNSTSASVASALSESACEPAFVPARSEALRLRYPSWSGIGAEGIVGIGRGDALQALVTERKAGVAVAVREADRCAGADAAVAAGLRGEKGLRRIPGEYLDHAADGIGAPQRGARTAHDLDAFDLRQRQVREIGRALGGRIDAHAIHQHQRMPGVAAAQEQRAGLARAARAGDVDACLAREQGQQVGRLAALDVIAREHGDRGEGFIGRHRRAIGGDDDRPELGIAARGGIRQAGSCGQGRENSEGKLVAQEHVDSP